MVYLVAYNYAEYCDRLTVVCLSVCLYVWLSVRIVAYLKNLTSNVTKFSLHVTYGRGSNL